jgi:hypothetical protein
LALLNVSPSKEVDGFAATSGKVRKRAPPTSTSGGAKRTVVQRMRGLEKRLRLLEGRAIFAEKSVEGIVTLD